MHYTSPNGHIYKPSSVGFAATLPPKAETGEHGKINSMMRGDLRGALRVTKALADAQRIRILMMLERGEFCVCQIVEVLGLAPSTVSKHLSILAAADLVVSRKDGRWAYYRRPDSDPSAGPRAPLDWLNRTLQDDPQIRADRKKLAAVVARRPEELCRKQRMMA